MAVPEPGLREALPRAGEAALLGAFRALASLSAYASGFRALSDDDYARITIAQRFAAAPHFDPSGTSWLPFPFWLYGAAFRVFGTDLAVARATAIALGTLATLLVYSAARVLGASRTGAMFAAALATLLPYSALLGIAAVPEVPCAALILFGAATLARREPSSRMLGAIALCLATLSRYEAWPVALCFAGCCAWDARRKPKFALAAAFALLGLAAWLVVGRAEHGSATFFIARVTSYKQALGASESGPLLVRVLEYPGLLIRAEPEIFALLLVLFIFGWRHADRKKLAPFSRPCVALLSLLAFLVWGSARDGAPTHHAARVLLPIWFFLCAVIGAAFTRLFDGSSRQHRAALLGAATAAAALGLWLRPKLTNVEAFAERSLELAAGSEAKRRGLDALALDSHDYGYFAIQAALGTPQKTIVLDDHDPRHAMVGDPFASGDELARLLNERGARFLLATHEHVVVAAQACDELWTNPGFALFRCSEPERAARAP